ATLGVADQRRHAGRACKPDTDAVLDAAAAQLLEPGNNAFSRKGKLRHDVDAQALCGRAGNFLVERSLQPRARYASMAFRIRAYSDFPDSVATQVTFLDHRERIGIGSGCIHVA